MNATELQQQLTDRTRAILIPPVPLGEAAAKAMVALAETLNAASVAGCLEEMVVPDDVWLAIDRQFRTVMITGFLGLAAGDFE